MKISIVSLDLRDSSAKYTVLHKQLRELNWVALQPHLWATPPDVSPRDVKKAVLPLLTADDGLFVFSVDIGSDDYVSHNPVA